MVQVAKTYDQAQEANAAVIELAASGFGDVAILNITEGGAPVVGRTRGGEAEERAERERSMVVVNPPFGSAATAMRILQRHGQGDVFELDAAGTRYARPTTRSVDVPAPFSRALGLPVLLKSAPLASLTTPRTLSSMLGIPELTRDQRGHASLIDHPAPFSSLLGLPVLIGERRA